jgi:hypothetical protein
LAVSVDKNRITAALVDSVYPDDKRGGLRGWVANADGVGLASNTSVADIDIVIARRKIPPGSTAQGNVVVAGVAKERFRTVGRIVAAGGVFKERTSSVSRIVDARCVFYERKSTRGRVVDAGCVAKERIKTVGRIVDAGGEAG